MPAVHLRRRGRERSTWADCRRRVTNLCLDYGAYWLVRRYRRKRTTPRLSLDVLQMKRAAEPPFSPAPPSFQSC